MHEKNILDFIEGRLSGVEERNVLKWIESSEENKREYIRIKNALALAHLAGPANTGREGLKKQAGKITRPGIYITIRKISRYAALVILTAGMASACFLYYGNKKQKELAGILQTVSTSAGQTANVTLPDGSEVLLNSASRISYPASFGMKERKILLMGEAYFEVAKNPGKPFFVSSGGFEARVTGTSFNMDAYPEEDQLSITLVEGRLEIARSCGKTITSLEPGENATIDLKNNTCQVTRVDTDFYTSWQRGYITFNNKRLEEIAWDLERWYNVEIRFRKAASRDIRYSGAILRNKPIEQVLEILKLTSRFNYDIQIDDDKKNIITIK